MDRWQQLTVTSHKSVGCNEVRVSESESQLERKCPDSVKHLIIFVELTQNITHVSRAMATIYIVTYFKNISCLHIASRKQIQTHKLYYPHITTRKQDQTYKP